MVVPIISIIVVVTVAMTDLSVNTLCISCFLYPWLVDSRWAWGMLLFNVTKFDVFGPAYLSQDWVKLIHQCISYTLDKILRSLSHGIDICTILSTRKACYMKRWSTAMVNTILGEKNSSLIISLFC